MNTATLYACHACGMLICGSATVWLNGHRYHQGCTPFVGVSPGATSAGSAEQAIGALCDRIAELEAALLNQQALATANVELAKRAEQAEAREDAWMGEEQIQRTRAEQAEAEVALLKATMHKVIPFIGWGAYVPDLVQEAEDVSGYGGRDEDDARAEEGGES
jgi:hypothetical protein